MPESGPPNEPWLTKKELARELRVSTRTIERYIPPAMRVGRQNRYFLSEAEAHLRGEAPEGGEVVPFQLGPKAKARVQRILDRMARRLLNERLEAEGRIPRRNREEED